MHVVIMSGIPGSGKDTYIAKMFPAPVKGNHSSTVIVSADDYFVNANGVYEFVPSKLSQAHGKCLRDFIQAVGNPNALSDEKPDNVIVNNTNTNELEMAPYVAIAGAYGATIELVTLIVSPEIAAARNVHGIPLSACQAMASRIQKRVLPPFWKFTSESVINETFV